MSSGDGAFVIRRILVDVDASQASIGVLETAAALAAGWHAELSGIFVEDINLLRLAGLPFARELAWSSAAEVNLDYQRMERVLRGRATHARQAVISVTTQLKLRGSLQIVRGHVAEELLQAARGVDLVILGKGGPAPGNRIGAVERRIAEEAPCSVLLVSQDAIRRRGPIMVSFAGQEHERYLLSAAVQVARFERHALLVMIPSDNEADYKRLCHQARQLLEEESWSATYQAVKAPDRRFYQRLIREEEVAVLVLDGMREKAVDLENVLATLDCSVLLVR